MASKSKAATLKGIGSPIPANRDLVSPHLFKLANYPDSVANGAEANAKWPTCCQIWGERLPCPNPEMDDGKWVSLDDAIEWSVKRGSSESKKLSCDSKAEQEEISAYNKKMDKALRSYLIKVNNWKWTSDGNIQLYEQGQTIFTNDIFFATSFQTQRKVLWPIFFRLSFREDMKEWETDIPNTLWVEEHPNDPALLNLKCYDTKSRSRYYGRGQKLGLFSCADKIAVLTHGDWSLRSQEPPNTNYPEFHAVDSDRNNMLGLNLTKTMTNRKNRNQIYIWVPDNRAKPSEQLGLVNWLGGFSRGKE